VGAAAGVAAIQYLERHNLIDHASQIGAELGDKLHDLFDHHPYVGDVRGVGLMWAIEFVKDKSTKQPFDPALHLANRIFEKAFELGLIVYAMSGSADGVAGDHIMISPPLTVSSGELDVIIRLLQQSLEEVFKELP